MLSATAAICHNVFFGVKVAHAAEDWCQVSNSLLQYGANISLASDIDKARAPFHEACGALRYAEGLFSQSTTDEFVF